MSLKTAQEIFAELKLPFAPEDLEWRLQQVNTEKPWGIAVPYVTNRAIQNRLDDVAGPDNWYNEYKPWHSSGKKESQLCGISIYFEETQRWVTKWDGAEDSDIEPVKGGLSDSMKRAAVQWGIGRILYEMDAVFVDVEQRGKTWIIPKKEQPKLDNAYLEMLKRKGLTPANQAGAPKQPTPKRPQGSSQSGKPSTNQGAGKAPAPQKTVPEQDTKPKDVSSAPADLSTDEQIYTVISAQVQPGMKGDKTRVQLQKPDGSRMANVYARGAHPELTEGMTLSGVRLAFKHKDSTAFYILEDYRVVSFQNAA